MIDWKDCIVRTRSQHSPGQYVRIAYDRVAPFLPIAVADSAQELADAVGVSRSAVYSTASRFRAGKITRPGYACVRVG